MKYDSGKKQIFEWEYDREIIHMCGWVYDGEY